MNWSQMRTDNQPLSPAQLQQLLSEYQLGGQQRPRGWYPPPEEVEPALRTCEQLNFVLTNFRLSINYSNYYANTFAKLFKIDMNFPCALFVDNLKFRFY